MKRARADLQKPRQLAVAVRHTGVLIVVEGVNHLNKRQEKVRPDVRFSLRFLIPTLSQPFPIPATNLAEHKERRVDGAALLDAVARVAGLAVVLRAGEVNEVQLADAGLFPVASVCRNSFVDLYGGGRDAEAVLRTGPCGGPGQKPESPPLPKHLPAAPHSRTVMVSTAWLRLE